MKHRKNSASGVALVIVLGFLVIISALAVAFFSSVNTEMKASRNFAAGITTRQLADSAVQIVMGQISSAVTRGIDTAGVGHEVWASQPGMIRVYGVNAGGAYVESPRADAFFKLYSSDQMTVTTDSSGSGVSLSNFDPTMDYLSSYDKAPAVWTDLNAPIMVRDINNQPTPRFPIIDPRAYAKKYDKTNPDPWDGDVEGFTYDESAVNLAVGPKGTPGGDPAQRLPMPVKWIYVLQDGTLTTPSTTGTTVADFSAAPPAKQPSAQNPIVGRIAFWTDDETSKLNLNTAAGYTDKNIKQLNSAYQSNPNAYAGSFWDTPRFYTQFDYGIPQIASGQPNGVPDPNLASGGLALCQLLQYEFQRYPGHPATTSFAPVFDSLLNSEQVYDVVPRYSSRNLQNQQGSTEGGTKRIIVDPVNTPGDLDNKEIQPKQDRLYATVDEFLYGAHVKGVPSTDPNYARVTNNTFPLNYSTPFAPISPQVIDKWRFFMTAQSRAPELNIFGQPRISSWPVRAETSTETTGMNVFDNLIFFCSTVGASTSTGTRPDTKSYQTTNGVYRYIFVRRETAGTTTLVSHPDLYGQGKWYEFNGSYVPDWQLPVRNQPSRNSELLQNYLYGTITQPGLTSRPIPGNGNKFSLKYSDPDRQGIITEIFDYIRLANSQDTTTSLAPPGKAIKFAPQGYVPPSMPTFFTAGGVQAKGFGRMSTICEAALVFYYAGPEMDPDAGTNTPNGQAVKDKIPVNLSGPPQYKPNVGWSRWDPAHPSLRYVKVVGLNSDGTKPPNFGTVKGGFMRAFILFSTFDPMQGYAPKADPGTTDAKLTIQVTFNSSFGVSIPSGTPGSFIPLGFPAVGAAVATTVYRAPGSTWSGRNTGAYEGFEHTLHGAGDSARPYKTMWYPPTNTIGGPNYLSNLAPNTTTPGLGGDYGETYVPVVNSPSQPGTYIQRLYSNTVSTAQEYYPFQTDAHNAIKLVNDLDKTFKFSGGKLTVNLYYGGSASNPAAPTLQTIHMEFPPSTNDWPVPQGAPQFELNAIQPVTAGQAAPTPDVSTWEAIPAKTSPTIDSNSAQFWGGTAIANLPSGNNPGPGPGMRHWYWTGNGCFFANMGVGVRVPLQSAYRGGTNYETSLQASWAFATRLAWVDVKDGDSWDPHTNSSGSPVDPGWWGDRWRNIVQPGDTIRSLIYWDGKNTDGSPLKSGVGPITGGDLRIAALSSNVPAQEFAPHPDYLQSMSRATSLRAGDGTLYFPPGPVGGTGGPLVGGTSKTQGAPAAVYAVSNNSSLESSMGNHIYLGNTKLKMQATRAFGNLPWGANSAANGGVNGVMRREKNGTGKYQGDFDTGLGDFPDGPFCNKQDEGNVIYRYFDSNTQQYVYPIPYFTSTWSYQAPGNTFTSPSRQMPSPGMMGSLPAFPANGGAGGLGWTTLNFCPNPAGDSHPGNDEPKDHYLLDFFQMPVVEPYPISEPFSTAGKVNLNYRIAPFDYIRRSTALRGALYPLRITAVNSQYRSGGPNFLVYKTGTAPTPGYPTGTPISQNFRLRVDRDMTVEAFDGFLDTGLGVGHQDNGFFKTASEVCERYLYSQDGSQKMIYTGYGSEAATMRQWWDINGDLTGDNEREKPYVDLFPRVTTKSNTFTVHMKVQTLRQTPGHPMQWFEGKDAVLGEYRGSSTIERYIDPADPRFSPGNSTPINPDRQSVEPLYRFRVVVNKKFTPT
jgi:hypothetical protein